MLKTRHDWIGKLAAESDLIAQMQLQKRKNGALGPDAFYLANCDAHCNLVTRAIRELVNCSPKKIARDLLCKLMIERHTYSAFAELAAYDWLIRCHLMIAPQVCLTATDVLATEGSELDGKIERTGTFFDVKAFGHGRLAQRLQQRLQQEFPDEQVLIGESWDLSFKTFQHLIEAAPNIVAKLKQTGIVLQGRMVIRLEPNKPVTVWGLTPDPYYLAKANALYPFDDAHQFTRNSPFILIFVVHPRFNALSIGNDFGGVDTKFTRSLARRAFMQFSADSRPLASMIAKRVPDGVTLADASRLLSAMFFINVWPREADPSITYPSWLYFNPRATHPFSWSASLFSEQDPNSTVIDYFTDDDY